jgi:hypothetical protein
MRARLQVLRAIALAAADRFAPAQQRRCLRDRSKGIQLGLGLQQSSGLLRPGVQRQETWASMGGSCDLKAVVRLLDAICKFQIRLLMLYTS